MALERLLPGLTTDLLEAGALLLDSSGDLASLTPFGWGIRFRSDLQLLACTRDLIDWCIRRRVAARLNVRLRQEVAAVGLVAAADGQAVASVRLRPSHGDMVGPDGEEELAADWVAVASGRDARLPNWLAALGYPTPPETVVNSFLGYATRLYHPPRGYQAEWKGLNIYAAPPDDPRGGAVIPVEGGRWLGMCRKQLPCFPEICYQALRLEPNREEGSMDAYAPEIERKMKRLFDSLSEDDRRRYAAVETTKLGHGGIEYIAQLLQCDPKTIRRGLAELDEAADLDTSRVRKKGGGRKKLIEVSAALEENFLKVLEDHTAGDPMRADVKWTNLSRGEIASRVTELGTPVSRHVVSQLLRKHKYRKRKALKKKTMGPRNPNRNAQFENIARLKKEYLKAGLPVISMDTKKKELLGNFYREGKIDTQETIETNDHDFGSAGVGTVIPHSLYDVGKNKGFVHLNTSHDTSELACDSLAAWWEEEGRAYYPKAKKLLLLCDGGGSNSATMYLFKEDLQKLADRLGIEIRVAHYPPYCSKWNPIEHRLFPHLTGACRGVIFHTLETVRYYMAKAKTKKGLKVKVSILDKVYETGRKYAAGFKKTMKIVFDEFLPKWNYRAVPQPV